ncbi:MAG: hypothetical protein NC124_02525 [Clostridium sp.]|nr:hypothetical protein [Clostridium sp.]
MTFEEALKNMREGKKVRCPSLSENTFELNVWNESFIVDDGISLLPLYGLKIKYILANDWEIVND